jgi:hypothetical protein
MADGFASQPPHDALAGSPGSPARARLAAAIRELAAAGAELAAAQEPATRLATVIAEAARLEAGLAALRAADQERLGIWLGAGGDGHRPLACPATAAAERQLQALAGDAAAAAAALPAAEQAFQTWAEQVRESQRRRDEAVCGAAIDAARGFAEAYRAALTVALEHEAVLHGLRSELLARGNRADSAPGAADAAARIGDLIAQTKRGAAVRQNPEAGRRLLAALQADPAVALQGGTA